MKNEILKQLLLAHVEGDDAAFRKAALQLASAESTAGHTRVAEGLRSIVAQMPARKSKVVDIAQPRGELGDVLEGGHREERLRDIVLTPSSKQLAGREHLMFEDVEQAFARLPQETSKRRRKR